MTLDDQTITLRIPILTGALNFRDLGGYETVDGRKLRWQILYRSGTTHAMTAGDLATLDSIGIRYAYDLRSNRERREFPSRLAEIAQIQYWFLDHERQSADINRVLRSSTALPGHSHDAMILIYQQLPYDLRDAYRPLFEYLAAGKVPLVFNCTAGKDRTGVAAALLLSALGVPREIILQDYLLTEQFFDRSCEMILKETDKAQFTGADRPIWEPIMRARPEYLTAMFDQLRESHGSVEGYLKDQLGVDGMAIDRLRSELLE